LLISVRNFYRPYTPPCKSAQQNGVQPWRQALLLQHKVQWAARQQVQRWGVPIMDLGTYRDAIKYGKLLGSKLAVF